MSLDFTAVDFMTAGSQPGSVCAVGLVRVRDGQVAGDIIAILREAHAAVGAARARGDTALGQQVLDDLCRPCQATQARMPRRVCSTSGVSVALAGLPFLGVDDPG
jgi:hypothetical protein